MQNSSITVLKLQEVVCFT